MINDLVVDTNKSILKQKVTDTTLSGHISFYSS